ncbi:MAG: HU family DNA-binding protein [Alloprevotella sp.]|nr:HU family DNA-binding protein [Alloprevotella sp.]
MAILYNRVLRKSPKNKSVKYYVTPKSIKLLKLRDIAKEVAKNETLSPQEVEHVLNSFVESLQTMLLNGYSVRLGDWASFHITCSSEGAETMDACRPSLIKTVRARVDFTKEFRQNLQNAEWVYAGDVHTTD